MRKTINGILILILGTLSTISAATESGTETYYNSIQHDPHKLIEFLKLMPKGADLHTHSGGTSLPENLLFYARNDHFCLDKTTYTVSNAINCSKANDLSVAISNPSLYDKIVDAWSMHHFKPSKESGHDHFFSAFAKYNAIQSKHRDEIFSEIINRAGNQNELYLELLTTLDHNQSGALAQQIEFNENYTVMRDQLFALGLKDIINAIPKNLDLSEKNVRALMQCETNTPQAGCAVTVRYLYQVYREQAPQQVFAQLLTGFTAAEQDNRIVGINLVQPEDGPISMRDYHLQMSMIDYFHHLYPNVHISLHAGELVPGLVANDGLRSHIREAIEIAHAERIGHAADITHEDNTDELLTEMANKKIMVEINLSSNKSILGLTGKQHPLPLYLKFHVPIALSTDDEGILRTNLVEEYLKASMSYNLSYQDVKEFSRNSIHYSFLSGSSLWQDQYQHPVKECIDSHTSQCEKYLSENEKAKMEWQLENRFQQFEAAYN